MIAIFRDSYSGNPSSQIYKLYGQSQGDLLGPLDLVLGPGSQNFNDAPIVQAGLNRIGQIRHYSLPSSGTGNVNPIVRVTPDSGVDLNRVSSGSRLAPPEVSAGDSITLEGVFGSGVLDNPPRDTLPYPALGLTVEAYTARFSSPNLGEGARGSRVVLSNGELLGMVIFTSGNRLLIYPADLV